jgi:2-keto-3-deoxy-6-phosphogluconate aldolase
MNGRFEFYVNTAEEIELVLEFAKRVEAIRAARYPQASTALGAGSIGLNNAQVMQAQAAEKAASL